MSKLERLQKYLIALILLLALVVAGGTLLLLTRSSSEPTDSPASSSAAALTEVQWYYPDHLVLGQVLTDHAFTLPSGGTSTLQEHLGPELTLVMYWGSWCSYCAEQTALLRSMEEDLAAQGVSVLLIDKMDPQKESLEAAVQKRAEEGISFDWLIDEDLTVYQELGLHLIPTTFLLDAKGRVLFCHAGVLTDASTLNAMLSYVRAGAAAQTEAFVTDHLMTEDGGVMLHPQASTAPSPSGQDVLSESQGLLMDYAVQTGNVDLFRRAYAYVQNTLDMDGLLRWYGTATGTEAPVNALLDDLRVLRALEAGDRQFGGCQTALARHAAALAEKNRDADGNFVDFVTFADGSKAHRLTMCYVDGVALGLLARQQPACAASVQAAQQLVEGAYLGDSFPFYANFYDYETGQYDDGSLNMAEALLTLLHQAEAGRLPEASLVWLHTQMDGNGIWARYDIHGEVVPGGEYQSPAVYALVGLIALECQDDVLLTQAVSRMEDFRCFREGDPLNGAFADSMDAVSSFDVCLALELYARMAH